MQEKLEKVISHKYRSFFFDISDVLGLFKNSLKFIHRRKKRENIYNALLHPLGIAVQMDRISPLFKSSEWCRMSVCLTLMETKKISK